MIGSDFLNVVKRAENAVKVSLVKLSRDAVVQAALELLDEVGLADLTLRGVAERLHVQAPALYWHVRNRQDLVDQMAAAMIRDGIGGIAPDGAWMDQLGDIARAYRQTLLSHRDGARVLAEACTADPAVNRLAELSLRMLTSAGFTTPDAMRALVCLLSYVTGFVADEQTAQPRTEKPDPVLFPLLTAAGVGHHTTETFEFGLELLLSGLRLARLSS
ncbi:tetracycline repressor protein class A [Kutzneria sp. 744]|nr:tetracycline repressor protein class A [Kutzneria sp. 744]